MRATMVMVALSMTLAACGDGAAERSVAAASQPSAPSAKPAEPVAKDVMVHGFKLHYLEAGSGTPIILLHGIGGDGSRWTPNIAPLSRDFHVFALDQIGFGESDKPMANYHSGMLAEFLVGFMDAVGLQKATLVGNSMGASVAAYTTVHYPARVDKLVLADGSGYRAAPRATPPTPEEQHRSWIQNGVTLDENREFFRIMWFDKSRVTDAVVEDALHARLKSAWAISKMQESGRLGRGGVTDEEMRAIAAPTLIVWGAQDELANPSGADRLARDIKGSKKVLIENCGHLPQLEKSAEFNSLVTSFVKTTS